MFTLSFSHVQDIIASYLLLVTFVFFCHHLSALKIIINWQIHLGLFKEHTGLLLSKEMFCG
jgi:hypothetical protein